MAYSYKVLIIFSAAWFLLQTIYEISARPGGEWTQETACVGDSEKIKICQRCAKQTKSPIVYPMCCNEEDEVHTWCYRYTNYGKVA